MKTQSLRYEADGLQMVSELYLPEGASGCRPGVLVFPEAFGLGEHAKSRAERLASLGYVALACDLHGGGSLIAEMDTVMGLQTAAPQDAKNIRARILVCIGAEDPGIPPEMRADFENEMRAGGVNWQMHLYGGVLHSFTNPNADALGRPEFARYDALADARSWQAMRTLFAEVLDV